MKKIQAKQRFPTDLFSPAAEFSARRRDDTEKTACKMEKR